MKLESKSVSSIMLALLLIGMLSPALVGFDLVRATSDTALAVDPSSIVDSTLGPGSIFRVNITVQNVQRLLSYVLLVSYDPQVLAAIDFGFYEPSKNSFRCRANDTAGWREIGALTYYDDYLGWTVVGPEPICWIDFYVYRVGTSSIDLSTPWPGYGLGNADGKPIPHVNFDGFFDNRPQNVVAIIDIDPEALNLKSKAQWITGYIQLPEGYSPGDVDASTILLNGTIPPVLDPNYGFVTNPSEYLVDHNDDGILERMVKFDRAAVISFIYGQGFRYDNVGLTITGQLFGGALFEGTCAVFVNYAGDVNNDGTINVLDAGVISAHWYPGPPTGPSGYDLNADLSNDGTINILDSGMVSNNWGQTIP